MMYLSILLEDAAAAGEASGITGLLPLLLIFVVIWLFMIRPQNKKQKEVQKAREALKSGDKVVTSGGIFGKIREVKDDSFIIEISENIRVRFEKNAVFAIPEQASKAADAEKKKAE